MTNPKFSIATGGMIKITEGKYNLSEFKFKNTKVEDKNLTFDIEFKSFFINNESIENEEDKSEFVNTTASNILKRILFDASKIVNNNG